MKDWRGIGYRQFEEARKFVRNLGLENRDGWLEYCSSGRKPDDIPSSPYIVYKNKGWKSMPDWLGNDNVATQLMQYRPFEKARKFVHKLRFTDTKKWIEYSESGKLPHDIPSNPDKAYKKKGK